MCAGAASHASSSACVAPAPWLTHNAGTRGVPATPRQQGRLDSVCSCQCMGTLCHLTMLRQPHSSTHRLGSFAHIAGHAAPTSPQALRHQSSTLGHAASSVLRHRPSTQGHARMCTPRPCNHHTGGPGAARGRAAAPAPLQQWDRVAARAQRRRQRPQHLLRQQRRGHGGRRAAGVCACTCACVCVCMCVCVHVCVCVRA